MLEISALLLACGDAVADIQDRAALVARAYGFPAARISVLPTMTLVALAPGDNVRLAHPPQIADPRLDQSGAVLELTDDIVRGGTMPAEARERLAEILASEPRFGTLSTIAGHVLMTMGLAFVLQPTWAVIALSAAFGALIGAMKLIGNRMGVRVGFLLPVFAAALISGLVFGLGDDSAAQSIRTLVPPLVTFLPGGLLTMALYDLASGEVITGASRFVAGILQLLMLGLGIVIGAELAGVPSLGTARIDTIGAWAPWAGVVLLGCGAYLFFSAPRGSLIWLLLVLVAAWVGQLVGRELLGAELSGFVGGLVVFPIAIAVQNVRGAPPAFVTFLPAFWLLVPGSLGLIGVAEFVGDSEDVGTALFNDAIISVTAVALGVLAGATIVQWLRQQRGSERVTGLHDPEQRPAGWVCGLRGAGSEIRSAGGAVSSRWQRVRGRR